MTETAFPPCSDCSEGNHGPCNRPFCGCAQAGHTLGPAVAPIGEVLDAATRAPASAAATSQAETVATPAPAAPAAPAAADPMALVDPAAVGQALAETLAPVLDAASLPPDAELELDVVPGQVGLPTEPTAIEAVLDEHVASFQPASEAQRATHDPQAALLVMAAPRDPSLHVSIWDGPRVAADTEPLAATEEELLAAMEADLVDTGNAPSFADAVALATDDSAHAYAGTPDAPYLCSCGKDPGSLNKLGSHLGIIGDADAMSDLGKQSVPHVVAQKARQRAEALAPADDTEKTSPGTGEVMEAIEAPADGTPTALEVITPDEVIPPELPTDIQALVDLNAADLSALAALTPPGMLPPLGPSEELDGPDAATQALMDAADGCPNDPDPVHVQVSQIDHLLAQTPAFIAELVRDAIEQSGPITSMGGMGEGMTPFRIVVVNGAQGWVTEALYGGAPIHPAVADEILEHFGFDPTPLDATVAETIAYATAHAMEDQAITPPPPASNTTPETRSMAALGKASTDAPQRVQVARHTTSCAECQVPIEPGDLIGLKPGLGTVHATHGG